MTNYLPTLKKMWEDGMTDYVSPENKMRVKEIVQKYPGLTEEQVKNWIRNTRRAQKHAENPSVQPKATKVSLGSRAKSSWNVFLSDFSSRDDQKNLTMAERNRNAGEAYHRLSEEEIAECKAKAKATLPRSDNDLSLVQQKALSRKLLQEINKMCQRISSLGHEVGVIDIDRENASMAMTGSKAICSFFDQNQHIEWKIMNVVIKSGNPHEEDRHRSLRQKVQDLFNQKYSATIGESQPFPYSKLDRGLISVSGMPEGITLKRPSHYGKEKMEQIISSSDTISFAVRDSSCQRPSSDERTPCPGSTTINQADTPHIPELPPRTIGLPSAAGTSNSNEPDRSQTETPTYTTLTNMRLTPTDARQTEVLAGRSASEREKRSRGAQKTRTQGAEQTVIRKKPKTVNHNLFEVEQIMSKKNVGGKTYFLIKWKGYKHADNTWEPEKHLVTEGAKRLLDKFKES